MVFSDTTLPSPIFQYDKNILLGECGLVREQVRGRHVVWAERRHRLTKFLGLFNFLLLSDRRVSFESVLSYSLVGPG